MMPLCLFWSFKTPEAWLIPINGTQFTSGFYAANPNSKIPAMMDYSDAAKPVRLFESGSIMLYLCDKPLSLQSSS